MKNISTQADALAQARNKATLIGRLMARNGVKLSRAEQLEALAYVEGYASWHVLAAGLKDAVFGVPVTAYSVGEESSWRVAVVQLDDDCMPVAESKQPKVNAALPFAALEDVRRSTKQLERLYDPENHLVAYVDGVLGLLVEQEFVSAESDGAHYCKETCAEVISRVTQHLLPMLDTVLNPVRGSRKAVVCDDDLVWNGRPTVWVFVPLPVATPALCEAILDTLQGFAYGD